MSTIIVACNTIRDELDLAIRATGVTYPVYRIDSKLHIEPQKLKESIQETIDRITNVSTIILAFGFCGYGLVGIKSEKARLILPKAEDCISLLLGSQERRTVLSTEAARYYLTRGWIESEHNIADTVDYSIRRFGAQRGLRVVRSMLKHYRYLTLLDTGGYDIAPYRQKTEELAEQLGLERQIMRGSQRFLEKLLTGPWDEEFIVADPGQPIAVDGFSEWSLKSGTGQQ
jgi:hypothetical protein